MSEALVIDYAGLYFGDDVAGRLQDWAVTLYAPRFRERYGKDAGLVCCILDPGGVHDWRQPLMRTLYQLIICPDGRGLDELHGLGGWLQNVAGKLHFSLRLDEPSALAEERPDLLLPGDFGHEGAGRHRGYPGGASGLPKGKDDWAEFCTITDEVADLRGRANARARVFRDLDKLTGQSGLRYSAGQT